MLIDNRANACWRINIMHPFPLKQVHLSSWRIFDIAMRQPEFDREEEVEAI